MPVPLVENAGESVIIQEMDLEVSLKDRASQRGLRRFRPINWILSKLFKDSNPASAPLAVARRSDNSNENPVPINSIAVAIDLPIYDRKMPVSKKATHYNMDHPRRGKAFLLYFDNYARNTFAPRKGASKDKENFKRSMRKLGFEVECKRNLDSVGLNTFLQEVQQDDHGDADCLVIAISTHGKDERFALSDGSLHLSSTLWEKFTASNCPLLAGKPKIFIFQCCRGSDSDKGFQHSNAFTSTGVRNDATDSASFSYLIPNDADMLMVFSCPVGKAAFRHPKEGSWLISVLCEVLDKYAGQGEDLESMLTIVKRTVALDKLSDTDDPLTDGCVQMPAVLSLLMRKVVFQPKRSTMSSSVYQTVPQIFNGVQNGEVSSTETIQNGRMFANEFLEAQLQAQLDSADFQMHTAL